MFWRVLPTKNRYTLFFVPLSSAAAKNNRRLSSVSESVGIFVTKHERPLIGGLNLWTVHVGVSREEKEVWGGFEHYESNINNASCWTL